MQSPPDIDSEWPPSDASLKKKVSQEQLASKGLDHLESDEFLIEISQYIQWFSATFAFLTQLD